MKNDRILHLTLTKCGSQWIRDVLCAPEIVSYSKYPYSGVTLHYHTVTYLQLPSRTFSGPIYGLNREEWQWWKQPGDQALVILRDPRDRLISWMFSLLVSHVPNEPANFFQRKLLSKMADHQECIMYMIAITIDMVMRFYLTWKIEAEDDALVLKYEDLIRDQRTEFKKIIDWLKWPVPEQTLEKVIDRLSFQSRSGRKPGELDIFSHYRRGIAGDWRNYFTRNHGRFWESLYPGFLQSIGYENSQDWWENLPEENENFDPEMKINMDEIASFHYKKLEQQLLEKEKEIQNLALACQERLSVIEQLQHELNRFQDART